MKRRVHIFKGVGICDGAPSTCSSFCINPYVGMWISLSIRDRTTQPFERMLPNPLQQYYISQGSTIYYHDHLVTMGPISPYTITYYVLYLCVML